MSQLSRQIDFLETLDQLPEEAQDRVKDLVRFLAAKRVVLPGKHLTPLHGTIDLEDAREMSRAIEEDCERIDSDGW